MRPRPAPSAVRMPISLRALGGPRHEQIRQVHAGDQQHQANHRAQGHARDHQLVARQEAQRGLLQRGNLNGSSIVVARVLLFQARSNGLERSQRLLRLHSRLEAPKNRDHAKTTRVEQGLNLRREHLRMHADRNPHQVRIDYRERSLEAWRRYANHRVRR